MSKFKLITSSPDYRIDLNDSNSIVYYDEPADDDEYLDIVNRVFGYIRSSSASNIAGMMKKLDIVRYRSDRKLLIVFPETGLHPNTQSKLIAWLINESVKKDINLSVITYSDHIFNAFRVAVAHKRISHEDLEIVFNDQKIPIDGYGRIENEYWVEGFFDQTEEDLKALNKF